MKWRAGLILLPTVPLMAAAWWGIRHHDARLVERISGFPVTRLTALRFSEDPSLLASAWLAVAGKSDRGDLTAVMSRLKFTRFRPEPGELRAAFGGCDPSHVAGLVERVTSQAPLLSASGVPGGTIVVDEEGQAVWICVILE